MYNIYFAENQAGTHNTWPKESTVFGDEKAVLRLS